MESQDKSPIHQEDAAGKIFTNLQSKDTEKLRKLKEYINRNPHIPIPERLSVCAKFGLPNIAKPFREVYDNWFLNYLRKSTTSIATVSKDTTLPEKYLTQLKRRFEKQGKLKVVRIGKCPTTGRIGVNFVSTKEDAVAITFNNNQFRLFDDDQS